jgi:hypothetical protein
MTIGLVVLFRAKKTNMTTIKIGPLNPKHMKIALRRCVLCVTPTRLMISFGTYLGVPVWMWLGIRSFIQRKIDRVPEGRSSISVPVSRGRFTIVRLLCRYSHSDYRCIQFLEGLVSQR